MYLPTINASKLPEAVKISMTLRRYESNMCNILSAKNILNHKRLASFHARPSRYYYRELLLFFLLQRKAFSTKFHCERYIVYLRGCINFSGNFKRIRGVGEEFIENKHTMLLNKQNCVVESLTSVEKRLYNFISG